MQSMSWQGARLLLGLAALFVAVINSTSPAAADDSSGVPAEVDAWFTDEAPATVADALGGLVTADGEAGFSFAEANVGVPVPLLTWSTEFSAGGSGAVVRPLHRWIAPLTVDGRAVGTVTAQRADDNKTIELSTIDDDAETSAALLSLDRRVKVIFDEHTSLYFTFDKGMIGPLSARSTVEVSAPIRQGEYQKILRQRFDAEAQEIERAQGRTDLAGAGASVPSATDGAGASVPSATDGAGTIATPAPWALVGIVIALASAVWLLIDRRRRAASTHRHAQYRHQGGD